MDKLLSDKKYKMRIAACLAGRQEHKKINCGVRQQPKPLKAVELMNTINSHILVNINHWV